MPIRREIPLNRSIYTGFVQKAVLIELRIPRRKRFEISRQRYSPVHAMQKENRVNELIIKQTETVNEGNTDNDGKWHLNKQPDWFVFWL